MASVNTSTGKIYGAKKGSLTWWHEKGHIEYSNRKPRRELTQTNFFFLGVLGLVINLWYHHLVIKLYTTLAIVVFIGMYIYEEVWCWLYALHKTHKADWLFWEMQ